MVLGVKGIAAGNFRPFRLGRVRFVSFLSADRFSSCSCLQTVMWISTNLGKLVEISTH